MKKNILIITLFIATTLCGTFGYMFLEHLSFWDSMYMTIITIATVGYGDLVPVHTGGKVFTVFLLFAGAGLVMYTLNKVTETMVDGNLQKMIERRNMNKNIYKLQDHFIICGFGRIGEVISKIFYEANQPFVVIEENQETIKEIKEQGYFYIEGKGEEDDNLIAGGIKKAKGLITVVSSDADNLFITLSARGLNPSLFILSRSSGAKGSRTKLLRAGASKVISPYYIGARRMAQLLLRPTVTDFIDLTMHASELGLKLEEIIVSEKAKFANKNLIESGIRKQHNIIIVAIKRKSDNMIFNPKPDTIIEPGDTIIVLGETKDIISLQKKA